MIDIILLTCNRLKFLKQVIDAFDTRLHTRYRLIVIDNNSKDGTGDYLRGLIGKGSFVYPVEIITRKKGEELPSCYAYNEALKMIESEFFVTTQDDIIIPQLHPDVLEQMIQLMKDDPSCGALCLRNQAMKRKPTGDEPIMYNINSCPAWFRLQRKSDMDSVGGFGETNRWEDTEMMVQCRAMGKRAGIASDLWCDDLGLSEDRGYPKWHLDEMKGHRGFEWINQKKRQYPKVEIDPKTNKPL